MGETPQHAEVNCSNQELHIACQYRDPLQLRDSSRSVSMIFSISILLPLVTYPNLLQSYDSVGAIHTHLAWCPMNIFKTNTVPDFSWQGKVDMIQTQQPYH